MVKQRKIPCTECEQTKRSIEEDGLWEVLTCEPIVDEPGWCEIVYQLKKS